MGLSGPRNRRKLGFDPNNTKWSRNENTFGQKILRAQGWEPGQYLGAEGASHAHLHTAANSAPIKVNPKDDTLGLGAKVRQKQGDECTGLDTFKDLLGRLNGKSEDVIEEERKVRSDVKTSLYIERRYGTMRFVHGGLLVGDQVKLDELASRSTASTTPEKEIKEKPLPASEDAAVEHPKKEKKEKKSKKRKAEEPSSADVSDAPREKKRKKRSKDEASPGDDSPAEKTKERKRSKKLKKSSDESEKEPELIQSKKKKDKKSKDDSKQGSQSESIEDTASVSAKTEKLKKKKGKKEKKRRRAEVEDASIEAVEVSATPQDSATSTPAGTGTSTPTPLSARHRARSRHIASKRLAFSDMQALNQIFMVKPV
ncbi:hypothetical protein F5X99DRAFT_393858 [Biscogniauxia marginata]|nr:hypothetical protein F5X99DRAFT_393858 [Biscogniauxia marginata]